MSGTEGIRRVAARCAGLVKRYPGVVAVDGLDLEVRRGECFGLLGPNGAGKTTTVEILEGLTAPDDGVVEVLGERWGTREDRLLRERLGIQLQETQLADKLTVAETVRLFRSFYRNGRPVDEVIALVSLEEKRDARVGKLSGGQKQRLALACALVSAPELMFLDEPTTGLDPQARRHVWEVIDGFRVGGGTVILTTHYMEEAARLCDRLAIVDHGRRIALGTLPGVAGVSARNGGWMVRVRDVGAALPAVLGELEHARAPLEHLTTHQATLEDVFVHLTGRGLRDG